MRRFKSSVTCLKEVEDIRKRTVTRGSEGTANVDKGRFGSIEMTSVNAETMA